MEGQYARRLLTPLIENGVSKYIDNIHTDMRVLIVDDLVLPVTVNDGEYENSYVCSPYSYYISYAKESIRFLDQSWILPGIEALLDTVGKILRRLNINKVVTVNNWLSSTTLYPSIEPTQLVKIIDFLKINFPEHAIIFRCVDPYTNPICFQTLQKFQFEYIATRPIFFIDPLQTTFYDSRLFKSDLKLLNNSGYEIIDNEQLKSEDSLRLLNLYQDIYINKYSNLNPMFNEEFLQLAINQKLFHFKALKKEGSIDAVAGYVERQGKMYCPFFGYDDSKPKEVALYRLLSTVLMREAYDRKLFFHQSSGASTFKKMRKAESCIEYSAIYCKHLKTRRRIPWYIIKQLYNSIGKRFMIRY